LSGTLRITKVKFFAGPSSTTPPLEIEIGKTLIFVGPNNSGKSTALREMEKWCRGNDSNLKVIDSMSIDFPQDYEEALKQRNKDSLQRITDTI
jgi:ABC-type cobalamin/Fe3+-siderophores transport system ATPase subunit